MKSEVSQMIENEVNQIINKAKVKEVGLIKKHQEKLHFIPMEYRVFSGMIQSMNIQLGNFVENLLAKFLLNTNRYEILMNSNNKKQEFKLSKLNRELIDSYIADCKDQKYNDKELEEKFEDLAKNIFSNKNEGEKTPDEQDVDLLFKDKNSGKYYYLEVKSNDDHDTGKYIDISRKFITTYACLLNQLPVTQHSDLVPILVFFNNKRLKRNPYIPEPTNIKRGQEFFDEFLDVNYKEVKEIFENLSKSFEIKKIFDDLLQQYMNISV